MCIVSDNPVWASLMHRGATIITFTATTDARLKKTGCPFGPVSKTSRVNGVVNFHYGAAVNRQRGREENADTFEPSPRKWGERLPGTPFVAHKGAYYLEVKVQRSLGCVYHDAAGNELPLELVAPYLPSRTSSADAQGVEREVIVRDYNLESISEVVVDGEVHRVEREVEAVGA